MDRRLTARGLERRRQLMDYSARLFARNGYDPTSVAEIVDGMSVGKGVFYWYFESKESLLLEILADAQRSLRRLQQSYIENEADPVRRIELGIRATMEWVGQNRHLWGLFRFAASEERFAPYLRRGQQTAVSDVVRHINEAISQGRVRQTDPSVLAHAILGVTNQLSGTFLVEQEGTPSVVADAAVDFCLDGLLGARLPV
ncbi:MAG TPA: TetR/AcrR family transcriptional regulator [Acidimicrobiales bacterium]|nr:TetR/AcrR family transcriptional regulator [Acidimicrobiales bacterium]